MRVLDLFSGLGGWSDPFRARGHEVLTLDNDLAREADIPEDLLRWDARELEGWPDVILASPPCDGFTVAAIGTNWTTWNEPKTEVARLGVALARRTREVIEQLGPRFFVVENPRGKLRKLPIFSGWEMRTVTYCAYGARSQKPTDLWGGFPPSLELLPACVQGDPCHARAPRGSHAAGSLQSVTGRNRRAKRAVIPEALAVQVCMAMERDST